MDWGRLPKVLKRGAICCFTLVVAIVSQPATAQECFTASPEVAKAIAEARNGQCQVRCSGCGCKGGPGYRSRDRARECVSWARLNAICGPPPHSNCDRECAPVVDGCVAPKIPKR